MLESVLKQKLLMISHSQAVIAIGSNDPQAIDYLQQALQLLLLHSHVSSKSISQVYRSKAIGLAESQARDFLNMAVLVETSLSPQSLLQHTQHIEYSLGKTPLPLHLNNLKYSRSIDLDLIFCDHLRLNSSTLQLPHPHAHQRSFVLKPLIDIWGANYQHPLWEYSLGTYLAHCSCLSQAHSIGFFSQDLAFVPQDPAMLT